MLRLSSAFGDLQIERHVSRTHCGGSRHSRLNALRSKKYYLSDFVRRQTRAGYALLRHYSLCCRRAVCSGGLFLLIPQQLSTFLRRLLRENRDGTPVEPGGQCSRDQTPALVGFLPTSKVETSKHEQLGVALCNNINITFGAPCASSATLSISHSSDGISCRHSCRRPEQLIFADGHNRNVPGNRLHGNTVSERCYVTLPSYGLPWPAEGSLALTTTL